MKDLRSLLIDCRIELRKLSRDFQKTELCERLDLAIQSAINASNAASAEQVNEALPPEKAQTVSQVALAWQTASRDLKFSDPAIHARLSEKVMRLLGAKSLVDPATEIVQLEQVTATLNDRITALEREHKALVVERDSLLGALATAVPKLKDGGDRLAVALARVAWLKAEADKAADAAASPAKAGKRAPEPQDTVPTPELLAAAAAGAAAFTKEQREWCVGEAMVLTGFSFTPVELIEKGDAAMAKIILDARKA
ncbi:hypothetical protein [Arenimonas terrae]|jgi:hypothetical protein|uniref:Uncharacterized protein n=1 Tax=Arenimonas terrae TaxID=2546226 RepID=A0A5C4RPN8_9GAMM|nr:hypothetical protein [Arenimonas terrae]TNJ32691.1 hypothetical protein E1B00_14930 [Arenimonas terrae]